MKRIKDGNKKGKTLKKKAARWKEHGKDGKKEGGKEGKKEGEKEEVRTN